MDASIGVRILTIVKSNRGTSLDLQEYMRILLRNWILVTASTLLGILAGGAAAILVQPTYTSETQLFVATQSSGSVTELQQGNSFSQARVQSYVKTVASPLVLQPAIDSLGIETTAADLAENVTASTDLNTVLINITVADKSPVQAAAIARAVADSLIQTVDSLEKPKSGGSSPVSLSVTKPAVAPTSPSGPNIRLNLGVGALAGLAVGSVSAFLRSRLDTRIRGESDIRQVTDVPVLGGIAFDQDATNRPLLTQAAQQSPRAESFRQLRTNLQFANVSAHAKTVLVTSSIPGEGKSTTATNLAIALAQSGQTVCLVDADLRRPMVSEYLGLDGTVGLTTALLGAADVLDVVQSWGEDSLFVLASGMIPPNPSELLGSQEMVGIIQRLEDSFDAVVIDAPPLIPVTDAAVLAQHVGGVIMVAGAHTVRRQEIDRSLNALQLVGAVILGLVLNRVPTKGADAYAYSYVSYPTAESVVDTQSSRSRRASRYPGNEAPHSMAEPNVTRGASS